MEREHGVLEHISNRIRELRTTFGGSGLSQEALARHLGVATNTVSRWETGVYKAAVEDLDKLARFFNVSILTFFPAEDQTTSRDLDGLLRAARELSEHDLQELTRYAEWRRAQSLLRREPAKRPPGRKPKGVA
jgi:transcriptional regulator with XRE-family HTH domain